MSNSEQPPGQDGQSPAPAPPSRGGGCLAVILILVGIVMLLPGLCAIILISLDWKSALSSTNLSAMVTFLAISAGGIFLIRLGFKGPRA
jgi:hypothetical protein